jgi:hypothetical protein
MSLSLPAFDHFPEEGRLIGRMLVGYGEIEYALTMCATAILSDFNVVVKVLFRARGEESRIEIADALMRHQFEAAGLFHPYAEAIADAHHCRKIRNQFAHTYFDGLDPNCLHFVSFEETGKQKTTDTTVHRKPVQLNLLIKQEAYFGYVQWCLFFLEKEYRKQVGQIANHDLSLPKKLPRPPLYTPET